jgi:hypothetical protein
MVGPDQPAFDAVGAANHAEAHWSGINYVAVTRLLGQLDSVVGETGVDLIGHGFEHVMQELPGRPSISRRNDLGDGELGCPVNA